MPDHLQCRGSTIILGDYLSCCNESPSLHVFLSLFFFYRKRETLNFKVLSVVYSWKCFMKISFVVNSRDGIPPHQYRKQHRREMQESAKANGRVPLPHFPVSYSWVISLPSHSSASTPPSLCNCLCIFFPLLHHWRCANLGSAVWQSLWWSIRIADGESEGCLNAAWCLPKLCALKPSRHESSPVTAWCLPLQLGMLLGKSHP